METLWDQIKAEQTNQGSASFIFLKKFIFFAFGWFCFFFYYYYYRECPGQLARTSTNLTDPEVNDHVSLQWPSYERPQGSNLRPKRKQTP
jgi:hypothetical protein